MSVIKERPECRKQIEAMIKRENTAGFYKRYILLRQWWFASEEEAGQPAAIRVFSDDTRLQLHRMFDELHGVYASIEKRLQAKNITWCCNKCGKISMPGMEQYRLYEIGELSIPDYVCRGCGGPWP